MKQNTRISAIWAGQTCLLIAWLLCASTAWAQIYTCVDAKGRKLTSDRPIAECLDREQKELNSNATVKRTVPAPLSQEQQRVEDEKRKVESIEKLRLEEEKRKDRALITRYPNRAAHDKYRAEALTQVDEATQAANKRIGELAAQRTGINAELEVYKKNPAKVPSLLKRKIDENDSNVILQKRFIVDQASEKKRIDTRFDDELSRLNTLWSMADTAAANSAAGVKK